MKGLRGCAELIFQRLDEGKSVVLSMLIALSTPSDAYEREKTGRISQLECRAHLDGVVRHKAASTLTEVACHYSIFEKTPERVQATNVEWQLNLLTRALPRREYSLAGLLLWIRHGMKSFGVPL